MKVFLSDPNSIINNINNNNEDMLNILFALSNNKKKLMKFFSFCDYDQLIKFKTNLTDMLDMLIKNNEEQFLNLGKFFNRNTIINLKTLKSNLLGIEFEDSMSYFINEDHYTTLLNITDKIETLTNEMDTFSFITYSTGGITSFKEEVKKEIDNEICLELKEYEISKHDLNKIYWADDHAFFLNKAPEELTTGCLFLAESGQFCIKIAENRVYKGKFDFTKKDNDDYIICERFDMFFKSKRNQEVDCNIDENKELTKLLKDDFLVKKVNEKSM
jgi:hypothetical protein